MLKENDAVIRRALVILDAFLVSNAFLATFLLRRYFSAFYELRLIPGSTTPSDHVLVSLNDYIVALFIALPIWLFAIYFSGLYNRWRTRSFYEIFFMFMKSSIIAVVVFGAIAFLLDLRFISRTFFMIFIVLSVFFLFCEKMLIFNIMRYVRKLGHNIRRVLIVGSGIRAAQFIRNILKHKEWGFKIVGAIDYEAHLKDMEVDDTGVNVIGLLEDIPRILKSYSVDEVFFVVPRSKLAIIENSLYICETLGIASTLAADIFELKIAKARQSQLGGIPLITFETTSMKEGQLFLKRVFDVIISGLGIIILSPLFLIAAFFIKATSPGPVFFLQKRVGLNGRKFILYKFRSMYKGAHLKLSELSALNEMRGPVFKMKRDPRVTLVGRFLRKFSIDELPQLFNVFIGHMSLVGPRPPLPKEVGQYQSWQRRRLSMRPGITCIWQVSGRNKRIDFDEWMKLDLQYIDNWSLWLDITILLRTVPVVFFGIGAY